MRNPGPFQYNSHPHNPLPYETYIINSLACLTSNLLSSKMFPHQKIVFILILNTSRAVLSNAAPVIYFPGALIYSAGFNVNQNLKKKF
jgi:hypothetical protein